MAGVAVVFRYFLIERKFKKLQGNFATIKESGLSLTELEIISRRFYKAEANHGKKFFFFFCKIFIEIADDWFQAATTVYPQSPLVKISEAMHYLWFPEQHKLLNVCIIR